MKRSSLDQAGYAQLQQRVRSGQAVFFFGAGMSIDGEGNSAARMIGRLYLRFRALSAFCIQQHRGKERALRLRRDLKIIFQIPNLDYRRLREKGKGKDSPDGELSRAELQRKCSSQFYQKKILSPLCERYYDFNDWICAAFEGLLCELEDVDSEAFGRILAMEEKAYSRWAPDDGVPPQIIDAFLTRWAVQCDKTPENFAGKTLFLDTMGFCGMPDLMGGKSGSAFRLDEVIASYRNKLQERHFVIARFAREGWAPLVLTTNFDRLLEGAFRLSGFRPAKSMSEESLPPVPVPMLETISEANQFFDVAGKSQTALIVKIHGCAEKYELLRSQGCAIAGKNFWEDYLKAMVFTFREIQNWRDDAWSRDFLRTLLRTRAMVFCGYSTRDPVIHDTLRSVYEEMTASRRSVGDANKGLEEAPAFFLAGGKEERDFHGIEVLRAASSAVSGQGVARSAEHPNYFRHQFRSPSRKKASLPDTDDVFLWTYHLAYRAHQADCLRQELRGLVSQLKQGPVDEIGIEKVVRSFSALRKCEERRMKRLSDDSLGHYQFRQGIRWTELFHPHLLREFACAEATRMGSSQREWSYEMRASPHYYFPASARPGWTAWAVVVELAIRAAAKRANHQCEVGLSGRPTILLSRTGGQGRLPSELLIHHQGVSKRGNPPRARGATLYQCVWELSAADYPWPRDDERRRSGGRGSLTQERPFHRARGPAPVAREIWKWATSDSMESNEQETKYLGIYEQ